MKKMMLALSLIAGVSAQVQAQDAAVAYQYGMSLDIAHVVAITPTADVCGVVPVEMTYQDSKGTTHILQFSEFGTGCSS
ncbi:MAG: DUF2790 domain-containing protein [Pseudomonas sp.]|jgi:hypothetical protein|uniref:DUF2790 domain-containing protein n=1 Tax=Pseudomonas mandelii TaxID=75612 RepID=A0ABY0W1X2_9PSED|nr:MULTISPECIES: DUF2790 domain-containing protein [Pseudomonas]MBA4361881.1 DUF2790 domain-containing protein [Pseudomonas sp.]MDO9328136.1 DUF2790 domain-containing protein [Pseudomonas sp.]TWS03440.1 DUF2790 domain-containing protein [Pseudomonas mandelii]WNF58051.1 DUF2790 domain-containing protein [Pseudomonas sp. SG20052]SDU69279.1 Protein of unknown function [Pseudomonas mandelii]